MEEKQIGLRDARACNANLFGSECCVASTNAYRGQVGGGRGIKQDPPLRKLFRKLVNKIVQSKEILS